MRNLLKLVGLNLLVFLCAFFAVMFLVSLGGDLVKVTKTTLRSGDKKERDELVVFQDKEHAQQVFLDNRKAQEGYKPYIGWRRLPLESETVNIGDDGLRVHSVGKDGTADDPSVAFFGGSTVWGTGEDDDSTIPAVFDEITEGLRVLNYGEAGWTSRQSLAQVVNLINQDKMPDNVVFYSGVNDVTILCNAHYGEDLNTHHEAPKVARMVAINQSPSYLYRNFVAPAIDTFERVTGRGKFSRNFVCDKDPARAAAVARTLFRNWQMAHSLMTAFGGKFFAFLQPVASVGKPNIGYLNLDPDQLAQYPAVYAELRKLMADANVDWAWDISDAFDGDTPLYMDSAHVIREGNARAATRIRDKILPNLATGATNQDR
ncbi:MAG TPA: SGNH/GDSL hydrolase family protein [Kiloniellaceae bacterium]|nr:SGNH/GDSL hydrolase family protein [Kiloniellaceae bacterium]